MPFVLLVGNKHYIKVPPRGSILLEAFRVVRLVCRKAASANPVTFCRNLTKGLWSVKEGRYTSVWEFAKPDRIMESPPSTVDGQRPKWLTWDASFVDELKRTMRACAIFAYFPLFWLPYS